MYDYKYTRRIHGVKHFVKLGVEGLLEGVCFGQYLLIACLTQAENIDRLFFIGLSPCNYIQGRVFYIYIVYIPLNKTLRPAESYD